MNSALETLTGGPGGCWTPESTKDTTFSYFPGVRFIRKYCIGEHGDPYSGIVALDSDSVLYLFSSVEALNFLLARHPIGRLDSATVLPFALVALELTGHSSGHSRIVRTAEEGGPQLRRALESIRNRPTMVVPMGIPRTTEWQVFFGRLEPAYEGHRAFFSEIWIQRDGRVSLVRDSLASSLPTH